MKSYKYGKPEAMPKTKKQKESKEEKSLLDWALEEKDYQLADELMKDDKIKNFDLLAMNKKIDKLQESIKKIDNPEIAHILAKHIVKKYHEGDE
tara:strand:+ start:306 stop:587 length:282 start_codon:yes stop_codon:yes gene_type:complete